MLNKTDIQEALKQTWAWENNTPKHIDKLAKVQDKEVSLLIHDIFGGEILKTHHKKGWHFYNRIEGERVDFSVLHTDQPLNDGLFEDIPSSAEETNAYLEPVDYSSFYSKFVGAFEEIIGLRYYNQSPVA